MKSTSLAIVTLLGSLLVAITSTYAVSLLWQTPQTAHAAPSGVDLPGDIHGYAWSSNIGWISLNCDQPDYGFNTCASSGGYDYGVRVNNSGNLIGHGWSSNIGWVQFGGLSSFPSASGNIQANARMEDMGSYMRLRGWVRACAGTAPGDCSSMASRSDGWDGWISLRGSSPNYGVHYDSQTVTTGSPYRFAWGDDVVGWIDWNPAGTGATRLIPDVDLDVVAFSRQGAEPTASADGTFDNVTFNAQVDGWISGFVTSAPYRLLYTSSAVNRTVSGTVNQPGGVSVSLNNLELGDYTVRFEVDLPASTIEETEEVANNFMVYNGTNIPQEPNIQIEPVDPLLRRGESTDVVVTVNSPHVMNCTLEGNGISDTFSTPGASVAFTQTYTTPSLNNTAVYQVTCTEPITSSTWDPTEGRVEVVPESQEV